MKRLLTVVRRLFLLTLLVGGVYMSAHTPLPRSPMSARTGPDIGATRTWGYQLQDARADRIAAGIDLLVIDAQRPSGTQRVLSTEEVERFRTRPDGRKRLVLAYLSVGEAETYRPYWWSHWRVFGPAWLGRENKQWKGNYAVRYWDPGWRRLIVDPRPSLLDRVIDGIGPQRRPALDQIIEAGFDGVYLDRVDAFYEWKSSKPGAEEAMMAFVAEISDYAKARRPGFLVVPQNGEELLETVGYRRKIDAIAKEDVLFGSDHKGGDNKPDEVGETIRYLTVARTNRLPVFVVEYVAAAEKRRQAEARLRPLGFIVQFADRALKAPPEMPIAPPLPASAPGPSPQPSTVTPPPARPKGAG